MSKLKCWFSRRGALPLTCYLAAGLLWLASALVFCAQDTLAYARGRLSERTMNVTDWQLVALDVTAQQPGSITLCTQNNDPQLPF